MLVPQTAVVTVIPGSHFVILLNLKHRLSRGPLPMLIICITAVKIGSITAMYVRVSCRQALVLWVAVVCCPGQQEGGEGGPPTEGHNMSGGRLDGGKLSHAR